MSSFNVEIRNFSIKGEASLFRIAHFKVWGCTIRVTHFVVWGCTIRRHGLRIVYYLFFFKETKVISSFNVEVRRFSL